MTLFTDPHEFQNSMLELKKKGRRIGFVPTMGALHEGHLSLVAQARKHSDFVVVSIFVNPLQFAPHEDFARYPRNHQRDLSLLKATGVDAVFIPEEGMFYGPGFQTGVQVNALTRVLEGIHRPHFFSGVCTVVAKLCQLACADVLILGEKDFQQFAVLKRCFEDLSFPLKVLPAPTIRESDGLAMSSRNAYLTPEQRVQANAIFRSFLNIGSQFKQGEKRVSFLEDCARADLERVFQTVQYFQIVDSVTLESKKEAGLADRIFFAGFLGKTRLIDNMTLEQAVSLL